MSAGHVDSIRVRGHSRWRQVGHGLVRGSYAQRVLLLCNFLAGGLECGSAGASSTTGSGSTGGASCGCHWAVCAVIVIIVVVVILCRAGRSRQGLARLERFNALVRGKNRNDNRSRLQQVQISRLAHAHSHSLLLDL